MSNKRRRTWIVMGLMAVAVAAVLILYPFQIRPEQYIAFESKASNLVTGDTNGKIDVFVADRTTSRVVKRIVAYNGDEPNDNSTNPSISGDGQYVAFSSRASNLVADKNTNYSDIFIANMETGEVVRVLAHNGDEPNGESAQPSISGDGKYIAFESKASNLVTGDTNGYRDIFIADRTTGKVVKRIVAIDGSQPPCASGSPSISRDGNFVAFASSDRFGTPGHWEYGMQQCVLLADVRSGRVVRRIMTSDGDEPKAFCFNPSLSGDGAFVAFNSTADNLVGGDTNKHDDVFVGDTSTGRVVTHFMSTEIDNPGYPSHHPSMSADGRYVAFEWFFLADGFAQDIFIGDRATGQVVTRIMTSAGDEPRTWSRFPSMGSVGRFVAFSSPARNFVSGDTNHKWDIFIGDRTTGRVVTRIMGANGDQPNGDSVNPSIN